MSEPALHPSPSEDPTRRWIAIAVFAVVEVVLAGAFIWAVWGSAEADRPALGLGEGIFVVLVCGGLPSLVVLGGALLVAHGRRPISAVLGGFLVLLGGLVGFVAAALVAVLRVESDEH